MDLKEEQVLGPNIKGHWYYVSKGRALQTMLRGVGAADVLDVGAGSGEFSRQLIDADICRSATCVDTNYPDEREETYNGRAMRFVRSVDSVPQRLILMMDVLEHVEDDIGFLTQYAQMMEHDATLAITVPAMQFLWSGHDVFLEHHRRYTRGHLESVVRAAGLDILESRYFFGLLFPAVVGMRLTDRVCHAMGTKTAATALKAYPGWLNGLLIATHDVERHLLFPFNRLAGLTVFCLARPRQ